MSIERIPETELSYYLIGFDADGRERIDDPAGPMSRLTIEAARRDPITDVFLLSHGWKGDVDGAKEQYSSWFGTGAQCTADWKQLQRRPGGFRPLLIGLHWPSLPWGNEEFVTEEASFGPGAAPLSDEELVNRYAERLADTAKARQALQKIFAAARSGQALEQLPADIRDAYQTLHQEAHLESKGAEGPPGADHDEFDPEAISEETSELAVFSGGFWGGLRERILSPLRQLSFWKMKDRARRFGEAGAHDLVRSLLDVRPQMRLHLMGHSFGCIVMSGALAGPAGGPGLPRPVHSLVLVQGALSLWSYCADIPYRPGTPGYFRPVVGPPRRVAGPIVTTRSRHDLAVERWYPRGARLARQVDFVAADFPRYGGVGTFGLRGPGIDLAPDALALAANLSYDFQPGRVYNLDCNQVISKMEGASGAHSDIAHPEIAHIIWSAALASSTPTPAAHPAAGPTAEVPPVSVAASPGEGASPTLANLIRCAGQVAADLKARVCIEIVIEPATPRGDS
jgi:hypothetical protein